MDACRARLLDGGRRSVEPRDFEAGLRRKIVEQDEAVQALVDLYRVFRVRLNSRGNLLLLGRPELARLVCWKKSIGSPPGKPGLPEPAGLKALSSASMPRA